MKRKLIASILIAFVCFTVAALGGNTCFTTTSQEDTLITTAVGDILHLGRPATAAEVKSWIITYVVQSVNDYQRRQDQATFSPTPVNPQ